MRIKQKNNKGFGVFFDPTKSTSGQRFFGDLCQALTAEALPLEQRPAVVLFNISAPWKLILKTKLNRQKIVLRVDGLYCDRLCPAFLASFKWPLRPVLALGIRFAWAHDFLATVANLLNQNYGGFFRILFADWLIYQSEFSRQVHQRYFPRKPFSIIVNGTSLRTDRRTVSVSAEHKEIRLVIIYDDWRPTKRMDDIVNFVQWANETKQMPIHLSIIGYTGKIPIGSSPAMKATIENSAYIRTLPRYKSFTDDLTVALTGSDLYITFSYRDACPNVVVEAMAHGLPVVGIGSGGVPDIVGAAGVLLPANDFEQGFFTAQRYEHDFPPIGFEKVLASVQEVMDNYDQYKFQVRERFKNQLGIDVVAERYACILRNMGGIHPNS